MFGRVKIFLTQVNGELKKVTWSTKDELINSAAVVIVSTVLLAMFIGLADYVISTVVDALIR